MKEKKFQNKAAKHIHTLIHVIGAPKLAKDDEAKDNEMFSFIVKYISCSIYCVNLMLNLNNTKPFEDAVVLGGPLKVIKTFL